MKSREEYEGEKRDGETPDRAPSLSESSEDSCDKIESLESKVLAKLKILNLNNKKAKLMARIYTSTIADKRISSTIPELDIVVVSDILERPHYLKYLEGYLTEMFSLLVSRALSKEHQKGESYLLENFDEIYDKYCKVERNIENVLADLKQVCKTEHMKQGQFLDNSIGKSESSPLSLDKLTQISPSTYQNSLKNKPVEIFCDFIVDVKDLDSPASKFLPQHTIIQRVPFKVVSSY